MLEAYNDAQIEAIKAKDGPVLVMAGAGSGKTSVLIQRIIYILKTRNVLPGNILAVTFTNKAANEIKNRIENNNKELKQNFNGIWLGTFHSICVRILYKHCSSLGYKQNFNIYDKNDSLRIIRKIIKQLGLDYKQYRPKTIYSIIENSKNKLIDENDFENESIGFYYKKIAQIYQMYQEEMKKSTALDYGDLILKTVQLFDNYPDILIYYQNKFKYILVDEYQDINHAQYILINHLSKINNNLFVVGDPDQSIYKFRGAELSNIIDFEKDYSNCQIIKLEQNYRSTDTILKGASFVIRNNSYRKKKEIWTKKEGGEKIKIYEANGEINEAEFVAEEIKIIKKNNNLNWNNIAVLYRTNAQSRYFEEIFSKKNIPFTIIGGMRFYERKEIKNIIYLLKLIDNPYDQEMYRRWLEIDKMGIGPKSFQKIVDISDESKKPIIDIFPIYLENAGKRINIKNKEKINIQLGLFKKLKELSQNVSLLTEELINGIKYYDVLDQEEDKIIVKNKIENVKSFLQSIKEYERANNLSNLHDYLTYISLITSSDNVNIENDEGYKKVHLMTLHCAKGLEFPVIFLTGMEEGVFPHSRSLISQSDLEEERRLCYVGMTRAMENLYLSYCWRRIVDGKTKYYQPSRFLKEIPETYLERVKIAPNSLLINNQNENKSFEVNNGDIVLHANWGEGKVINKIDTEKDIFITVYFKQEGIKRLSLKYAPLKKIEKAI